MAAVGETGAAVEDDLEQSPGFVGCSKSHRPSSVVGEAAALVALGARLRWQERDSHAQRGMRRAVKQRLGVVVLLSERDMAMVGVGLPRGGIFLGDLAHSLQG